jgi:hypothetical protein
MKKFMYGAMVVAGLVLTACGGAGSGSGAPGGVPNGGVSGVAHDNVLIGSTKMVIIPLACKQKPPPCYWSPKAAVMLRRRLVNKSPLAAHKCCAPWFPIPQGVTSQLP